MKLRDLRIQRDITQQALAAAAGVTKGTISHIECHAFPPRMETMLKVAKALDVQLAYIDEFKQRIAV
jgi:transcriptional regulator with XRE-family HTH domain